MHENCFQDNLRKEGPVLMWYQMFCKVGLSSELELVYLYGKNNQGKKEGRSEIILFFLVSELVRDWTTLIFCGSAPAGKWKTAKSQSQRFMEFSTSKLKKSKLFVYWFHYYRQSKLVY